MDDTSTTLGPTARRMLRAAFCKSVKREVAATSARTVAARLDASEKSVVEWASGRWPAYTTALRLAPRLGLSTDGKAKP